MEFLLFNNKKNNKNLYNYSRNSYIDPNIHCENVPIYGWNELENIK